MLQLFLPYLVAVNCQALISEAAFCTGRTHLPIAFTSEERVVVFVKEAKRRLGLHLDWGVANELEFPRLGSVQLDLDPTLPEVLVALEESQLSVI